VDNSTEVNMTESSSEDDFLGDPPEFHQQLVDYGERPYWSPDGSRIAFID